MKWKLVYKDGKVKHEDLEDNTELPKYVLPFSIGLEKESNELFIKNQREYVDLKEQFPTASRSYDESLTSFL